MKTTKIEWTDTTWNPVTGCTKLSAGCQNCYAEVMARRLCAMGVEKYSNGFNLRLHEDVLGEPLKWKKSHTIFVNSMSDLFHKDVPFSYVDKVMKTIESSPQHRYQLLTKRAERMFEYFKDKSIPENAWLGVTVENQASKFRIDFLRQLKASVLFLSCEPLLEDLGVLNFENIDWVIVGGESGSKARPMSGDWVLNIKNQCEKQNVAFFFKQWGTWGADGEKRSKKANGKLLEGKIYQAKPEIKPLRISNRQLTLL
ncbi:MAG: phage Gp37/Gp68 family protein [Paludibacteraceae bacterium]|nr:phage Gp37/Gp68 family protein [Paludibacteraceae bacterium]MBN2787336.1 phage Gp37/Gp68 family protein [Paludibacteraceae bacterium]